jgi:hypothetical protein
MRSPFIKRPAGFAQHESVKVIDRQKDNLLVKSSSGARVTFHPAANFLFDVGYAEKRWLERVEQ